MGAMHRRGPLAEIRDRLDHMFHYQVVSTEVVEE